MPISRKVLCHKELLRDLYENWLILSIIMFVHWNRLPQFEVLPPTPLNAPPLLDGSNYRLGELFFGCGLMGFVLPFRGFFVRRCRHRVQLLLLTLEVMLLLRIVEFNDIVVWQPILGIYRDMFQILGQGDYRIYRHVPCLATWLEDNRAFEVFQLLLSFAFFLIGLTGVAEGWMKTVDHLLLGYGPEMPAKWGRQCQVRRKCSRHRRVPPETTPDRLMYRRLSP